MSINIKGVLHITAAAGQQFAEIRGTESTTKICTDDDFMRAQLLALDGQEVNVVIASVNPVRMPVIIGDIVLTTDMNESKAFEVCRAAFQSGLQVMAIKAWREFKKCGLKEAHHAMRGY